MKQTGMGVVVSMGEIEATMKATFLFCNIANCLAYLVTS